MNSSPLLGDWSRFYFVAVCCFVVFNIADYVGKQLAVWIQKPGPSKWGQLSLLVSSILRIGFIPLFMFCNVSVNNRETNILIHSDAAYIVLMVLFGISNGYIGNIAMMFGPGTVKDPKYGVSSVIYSKKGPCTKLIALYMYIQQCRKSKLFVTREHFSREINEFKSSLRYSNQLIRQKLNFLHCNACT